MSILVVFGDEDGFGRGGFFLWSDGKIEWMKGKEEDLEGVIPQGPSGNSIGFRLSEN